MWPGLRVPTMSTYAFFLDDEEDSRLPNGERCDVSSAVPWRSTSRPSSKQRAWRTGCLSMFEHTGRDRGRQPPAPRR